MKVDLMPYVRNTSVGFIFHLHMTPRQQGGQSIIPVDACFTFVVDSIWTRAADYFFEINH